MPRIRRLQTASPAEIDALAQLLIDSVEGGKTLLVPDTASAEAWRLYERAGCAAGGTVPGYALLPHGGLCATTFFYRELN